MRTGALFLDRDGTIIFDRGYIRDAAAIEFIPGALEALRCLAGAGWRLIVVSNQSGVGRGIIAPEEMEAVQSRFLEVLRRAGVEITASYLCPHHPEIECGCRKPSPGSLLRAAQEHGIELNSSWMIGDREGDIVCGRTAGCSTIWMRNREFVVPDGLANFIADDWSEVVRTCLSEPKPGK